eukprot:GFKZ01015427.1.p1 GENE.GFKZ01015427.1~~GFKZ01015427.1.p1  ORF type:complete len:102 (+),score=2.97 GFKZ01015427.1:479-784(+)
MSASQSVVATLARPSVPLGGRVACRRIGLRTVQGLDAFAVWPTRCESPVGYGREGGHRGSSRADLKWGVELSAFLALRTGMFTGARRAIPAVFLPECVSKL